ncbi:carbamoyl-phosphate synthase large subunit [Bacillus paranthracis]|uniref:carbamoyl phosphate synthase large subunit n=1 Tax=Bacillus cereus group TaxID=86661 RepID=UPI0005086088|nr:MULTISPECIES: carbamoyl phosphate synthase large subunit [Bacillus cereus group]KFL86132.1 putative membrane protein [Bacillus cereus]MRA63814.1 carbamoyl-phosphate synthase large subunit [Bacillus thuringiensis]OUB92967.1 carbamoyl-phosphate synthase large subunit [Bacillus thuringiensis serovar canadensis]MBE5113385.1 carbamoyl-phosphate synthase large subunit [Bacillus paranthracis]MDA1828852.1 carbamoyl-phosphate synthase large subunit [Bacillus cereus group sp. BY25LC]
MSDGRVDIETRLELDNIRRDVQRVNAELGRIGNNMGQAAQGMRNEMGRGMQGMVGDSEYYARQYRRAYGNEIGGLMSDMGGSFRYMSAEARGMMFEMMEGFHAQKMAMIPFKEDQIKATYGFYKMAQASKDFQGTNQDFINQANDIGKAMKASQDAQINANRLAMMGMLQTIGAMNAMSSAASKTTKNLDQMKNPLYNTARPALALVDSLDRVARSGSAAQIALELHGPQASMKTLTDEAMRLNTVMMGMPIVAIGVGMSALFMYGALHKANMEMNPKYAEAFNEMMEKLTKALEPMRQAFAAVAIPIFNFVTKLAELTIAFNEAHPSMARFIQGTIMLVPALMALMLPLALGVGYFRGLRAILFALRPIIMPVVTAFATMSTPVWILAAAIAGLTVGFTHFYKTNEKFKGFVDGTIKSIKDFGSALVKNTSELIQSAYKSDMVQNSIKALQTGFATAGKKSLEFGSNMASLGKYLYYTALDGDHLNDWITHLPESWQSAAMATGQAVSTIRGHISSLFGATMQLGKDLLQLGSYLTNVAFTGNIFSDALNALPPSVQGLASSFAPAMLAVNSFGQSIVALGKYLYFAALDGDAMNDWITHLPVSWQAAATSIANTIVSMTTSFTSLFGPLNQVGYAFLNLGRYLLSVASTGSLMNGWLNLMPVGFQTAGVLIGNAILTIKTAISSLVEAVRLALGGDTSQLGQIFMTIMPTLIGMLLGGLPALLITASHFLPTIVNGINTMLPLLTTTITNMITGIVTILTTYLPQFLDQGIKILTFLINGVVQVLPVVVTTLVQVATELVNSLVTTIGTLLPLILDAGIKILMAIIDGIIQNLPQIINAAMQMITMLANAIANLLPQIIEAGIKILMALIDGILKILPNLVQTSVMLITKVCEMLIQNLPKIIDAGMKILTALIEGILKILPQLIETGIRLIVQLVNILMQNMPKIWAAGMKILQELIRGIIQILPQLLATALKLIVEIARILIANLPQIWNAGMRILAELIKGILSLIGRLLSTITTNVIGGIKKCFSNAGTMLTSIGKNIIQGLINGISGMVGSAVSAVKRVASSIKDGIADFFDIHSPSRVTYAMGEFVTKGLANGIVGMTKYAVKKARTLAESVLDGFSSLKDDIVMGDIVGGDIDNAALNSAFSSSKRFVNDMVNVNPTAQQAAYIAPKQERQVKTTPQDNNQRDQNNTYIVMDKKVVGEVLAQPVETTNNRRKQRLAQFKPTVTPSF